MPERVHRHVVRNAAASVGVRSDIGGGCEPLHDVVNGLPGHPVVLLLNEEGAGGPLTAVEVNS